MKIGNLELVIPDENSYKCVINILSPVLENISQENWKIIFKYAGYKIKKHYENSFMKKNPEYYKNSAKNYKNSQTQLFLKFFKNIYITQEYMKIYTLNNPSAKKERLKEKLSNFLNFLQEEKENFSIKWILNKNKN